MKPGVSGRFWVGLLNAITASLILWALLFWFLAIFFDVKL